MGKVRVAIIGAGGIAHAHIRGLNLCKDAEIAAVCDVVRDRADEVAKQYEIPSVHADYMEVLKRDDIDAVVICTPNVHHHDIALASIKTGKHVLCEKPLAMNAQEAKEMYETAEKAGIKHMVAFSYHFWPSAKFAKYVIDQGFIGRIFHVVAQYSQGWLISPDAPLVWRLVKSQTGTGVLGDLGSHLVDLVRWFTGLEINAVSADMETFIKQRKKPGSDEYGEVDVDDYVAFVAHLSGGARASFVSSRYATGQGNYQRIEIYGDKGSLIYEFDKPHELSVCLGEGMIKLRQVVPIPVPESFRINQHQDQENTFVQGIAANKPIQPTFYDGFKAQEVLDAVVLSANEKRWVELPLTK